MRSIKFKVWDIEKNIFITEPIFTSLILNGVPHDLSKNEFYIAIQFTGRLDKNKQEIYESDRIKWNCQGSIKEGTVYWANDGWWVKDDRGGNKTHLSHASGINIIGNTLTK